MIKDDICDIMLLSLYQGASPLTITHYLSSTAMNSPPLPDLDAIARNLSYLDLAHISPKNLPPTSMS